MVKAELKNYRQSPRKVRLVADIVRGKKVNEALNILTVTAKRSSLPIKKLVESAIANAKHNFGLDENNLFIKEISVNEGVTIHRWMPRARGSAAPIRKRTSRVFVILGEVNPSNKNKKPVEVIAEVANDNKETKSEPVKKTATKKVVSKNKK